MADKKRDLTEKEQATVDKVKEILATELEDADLEEVSGGYTDINFGCGKVDGSPSDV